MRIDFNEDCGRLFTKFHYPAGEWQVRLTDAGVREVGAADDVLVVARIQHGEHLMQLALLVDAIRGVQVGHGSLRLFLPYLPYARADRRFMVGDCCGLGVFCHILSGFGCEEIMTLDQHSKPLWPVRSVPVDSFIERSIKYFAVQHTTDEINILFPDAGAKVRYSVNEYYEGCVRAVRTHVVCAEKVRDAPTGELKEFKVPGLTRPTIIVDDICDGGGTFIGIAKKVNKSAPLGLYVTHAIFSKGINDLLGYFSNIYTTNSVAVRFADPRLVVYGAEQLLDGANKGGA